ncbi:siroheme synthase CysG [Thiohalobacter sp. IOR34]|uniref:siroheme synthase CysG n=1 Tax=Thiohalobacter sp. IOR34 TaxID=3057176 RepID=UPI0025AF0545|nr:siroheme synthase CysG [Thiohalobacter sp. IOR34]WJW74370.1 siroheme synthase CysG [Thiohalobacter sp. IOR34]
MDFLPVFFTLKDQPCLVVGGGAVAARKAGLLSRAGGRVRVVAPELGATLAERAARGEIEHRARTFEAGDLDGMRLVIAATDDRDINAEVSRLAQARGIPVNVVDDPALCSFIMPSILDRSPVMIAVSSGGTSPVLARQLRSRLESLIPSAYGRLAQLAEDYREAAKERLPDEAQRRRFWEDLLQGPVSEMVFAGRDAEAREALEAALAAGHGASETGEVYLVGAGPGDPDLLTFRAVRLMQQADVVVYDRLVSQPILDMTRRDAERYYVGKEKDNHAVPQEGINQLLVDFAKQGKRVLRLKGGDPFIFGRGGEEIETLAQEGIPFQVVPGITAAAGCASYSGIPLTHRDYAQSCTFVTGHLKDGSLDLNWPALAQPRQTVVFYMGLTGISVISEQLIRHGVSPDMPAALVEQGTTPNQRVLVGTVGSLPRLVEEAGVRAPTLTIVGEVVQLHDKLDWYHPQEHVPGTVFRSNSPAGE